MIAGSLAVAMRAQLVIPNNTLVPPEVFNRLFTMHGTTMVFFVGMPFFAGSGELSGPADDRRARHGVPAAERIRFLDHAVRRDSAVLQLYRGRGPGRSWHRADVGWFAYAPLTERAFSRGTSTDYWILSIMLSGIGSTITAINVIATAMCLRTKGMTLAQNATVRVDDVRGFVPDSWSPCRR